MSMYSDKQNQDWTIEQLKKVIDSIFWTIPDIARGEESAIKAATKFIETWGNINRYANTLGDICYCGMKWT